MARRCRRAIPGGFIQAVCVAAADLPHTCKEVGRATDSEAELRAK